MLIGSRANPMKHLLVEIPHILWVKYESYVELAPSLVPYPVDSLSTLNPLFKCRIPLTNLAS